MRAGNVARLDAGRRPAESEGIMRKTNSKEARRAAEAYVMEEVRDVLERCDVTDTLRPVDEALKIMRNEMEYQSQDRNGIAIVGKGIANMYRKSGRVYGYIAAVDPYNVWTLAASAGCFECYYDSARDRLAEWLDETPEESAQYSNDQVWNLYIHMSAQAFERLHHRENDPHTVRVSEFIALYDECNGGHFFDRATLKFWGQTRKSFDIEAFYMIEDHTGTVHDCYKVYSRINFEGCKETHIHYFDRETLQEVFARDDSKEV